jgi:hypothetical protein
MNVANQYSIAVAYWWFFTNALDCNLCVPLCVTIDMTSNRMQIPKKSLLILGVTALISSRALFFFFNDPEGPNLLIVMAAILFALSMPAYLFVRSMTVNIRLVGTIVVQILFAVGFYFAM